MIAPRGRAVAGLTMIAVRKVTGAAAMRWLKALRAGRVLARSLLDVAFHLAMERPMRLMKAALFSSAFALIAAGASPVAIAAPNNGGQTAQQRCEAGGHLWDSVKGCANKT